MNYAARLARLEKLAGKGACPWCRLIQRHTWPDPGKASHGPREPSLLVTRVCDVCGSATATDLSRYPEELRELARLCSTSKLEDTFISPRAWAALSWSLYRGVALRCRREALREMKELAEPAQTAHERQQREYARRQREREREEARAKDPDVKLYGRLLAEASAQSARRVERLKRRYGENPFPELTARIQAVGKPDYYALHRCEPNEYGVPFGPMHQTEREAEAWLRCAEMEKVVLGRVSAHTEGRVADCERRARELVAAVRARHEER